MRVVFELVPEVVKLLLMLPLVTLAVHVKLVALPETEDIVTSANVEPLQIAEGFDHVPVAAGSSTTSISVLELLQPVIVSRVSAQNDRVEPAVPSEVGV